jgi:hypothetical protein
LDLGSSGARAYQEVGRSGLIEYHYLLPTTSLPSLLLEKGSGIGSGGSSRLSCAAPKIERTATSMSNAAIVREKISNRATEPSTAATGCGSKGEFGRPISLG